jgi:cytoskeleton protein RodZ
MPDKVSIGQTLRKQREERGLTPEQAAYQSKVPLRLLQALEADDYRLLPDPAYLIRLLHEYALLLKLDPKALDAEFRSAIRRPPGASLAPAPSPPPPAAIPWKQVLWTAVAILVVTPLVFIALSLASKRAAERPGPQQVAGRPVGERAPAEGTAPATSEPLPAVGPESVQPGVTPGSSEVPAPLRKGPGSAGPTQETPTPAPSSPQAERKPRRFLLAARAVEPTWMAVRADDGQQREVLLQKGQTARFVADTGFVVTVGNAGGVELSLNGKPMPLLGVSGQVIRDLVIPPVVRDSEAPGASSPGAAPPGAAPER